MSNINTSCLDCIFAIWNQNVQIDCNLGRLEKFRKAGIIPQEVYDENNKEFFIIPDKYCLYCRNKEWGEKYKPEFWQSLVEHEVSLQYNVIIMARNSNLLDIEKTIKSVYEQQIKPKHITVIFDENIKPPKISRLFDIYKCEWRLQQITSEISDLASIDLTEDIINFPYYIVIRSGNTVDKNMSSILYEKIFNQYLHFGIIKGWARTEMVVPKAIHKAYSGNSFESLESKLRKDGFDDKIFENTI